MLAQLPRAPFPGMPRRATPSDLHLYSSSLDDRPERTHCLQRLRCSTAPTNLTYFCAITDDLWLLLPRPGDEEKTAGTVLQRPVSTVFCSSIPQLQSR